MESFTPGCEQTQQRYVHRRVLLNGEMNIKKTYYLWSTLCGLLSWYSNSLQIAQEGIPLVITAIMSGSCIPT